MSRQIVAFLLLFLPMFTFAKDSAVKNVSFLQSIDNGFAVLVSWIASVLFFKILGIPLILFVLIIGGIFFTFRFSFINIRLFKHSIDCIRGKYDNPNDVGEISHFKALTSALSATVGLGNIAGVAIAIGLGGAGAVFWMWVIAFFGMSMKFMSATTAQYFRRVHKDGAVLGGPMVYLNDGIKSVFPKLAPLGVFLGGMYAVLVMFASFGGGNMFQANTATVMFGNVLGIELTTTLKVIIGLFFSAITAMVILGGIKRIGEATSKMVPFMAVVYVLMSVFILIVNYDKIIPLLHNIITQAFAPKAMYGGFFGVLITGMKRGAFSNEAGLGSASIAHSAAKTDEPVREGVVAMIGPVVDTIIICTMTALVILITVFVPGQKVAGGYVGALTLSAKAFGSITPVFSYVLMLMVFIFAFSTMVSWSYYGERGAEYLFGRKAIKPYKIVYVFIAFLGPIFTPHNVIDFTDLMILSLAFPNIIGAIMLSNKIAVHVKDYLQRYRAGKFTVYK